LRRPPTVPAGFLRIGQVAELLHRCRRTVWYWAKTGRLHSIRPLGIGAYLFYQAEIEQKCKEAGLPFQVPPIFIRPTHQPTAHVPLDPYKIVWFAALVDGEGSITLHHRVHNGRPMYGTGFSISNTCKPLLDEAHRLFGGSLNGPYKYSGHQKPYWELDYGPSKVLEVLPKILPYLIAKKPVGELVLEAQKILRALRGGIGKPPSGFDVRLGEIYEQVRRRNKRGDLV